MRRRKIIGGLFVGCLNFFGGRINVDGATSDDVVSVFSHCCFNFTINTNLIFSVLFHLFLVVDHCLFFLSLAVLKKFFVLFFLGLCRLIVFFNILFFVVVHDLLGFVSFCTVTSFGLLFFFFTATHTNVCLGTQLVCKRHCQEEKEEEERSTSIAHDCLGGAARMTVTNNGYYREARTGGVSVLGTTSKCFVTKIQTN